MQHGAQVTDISEGKVLDRNGNLVRTYVVTFMVGEMGPFTVSIPEREFTPERARQLVEEKAGSIAQLRGG